MVAKISVKMKGMCLELVNFSTQLVPNSLESRCFGWPAPLIVPVTRTGSEAVDVWKSSKVTPCPDSMKSNPKWAAFSISKLWPTEKLLALLSCLTFREKSSNCPSSILNVSGSWGAMSFPSIVAEPAFQKAITDTVKLDTGSSP